MKKFFYEYEEELQNLLHKFIRMKTINPPGNEYELSEFIYDYMIKLGIESYRIKVEGNRYNIISILRGENPNNGIIFTGHMDVVPVSDDELTRWTVAPFLGVIKDNHIYGRGSSDMKSGLATIIIAMKYLKENNIHLKRDIALVATVDEEDEMKGSKSLVGHELLKNFNEVIVCEPTNLDICNISRGRTFGILNIKGKTGHGSQGANNNNAILIANKIINKMMETDLSIENNNEYGTSFWQPLAIDASVDPWVVPDSCVLKIDARLVPNHYSDHIWQKLDHIITEVKNEIPEIKVDITILDKREPWITSMNSQLMKDLEEIYNNLNFEFKTDIFKGSTDGTILRKDSRDTVILGPGILDNVHMENEKVSIDTLNKALKLYIEIMKR